MVTSFMDIPLAAEQWSCLWEGIFIGATSLTAGAAQGTSKEQVMSKLKSNNLIFISFFGRLLLFPTRKSLKSLSIVLDSFTKNQWDKPMRALRPFLVFFHQYINIFHKFFCCTPSVVYSFLRLWERYLV